MKRVILATKDNKEFDIEHMQQLLTEGKVHLYDFVDGLDGIEQHVFVDDKDQVIFQTILHSLDNEGKDASITSEYTMKRRTFYKLTQENFENISGSQVVYPFDTQPK